MNLINSKDYSGLKSRVNLFTMISDLYKFDNTNSITMINFNDDYKEKILSNIKKTSDNRILFNTLFYISIHEMEINENIPDFEEIKSYIWNILKKDNTLDTFYFIIEHINFIYNTYSFEYEPSQFFDYLNNFEDFSLIEDIIPNSIPINSKSFVFYMKLITYFFNSPINNADKIVPLLSKIKCQNFEDNSFNDFSSNNVELAELSTSFLFLKVSCFSYYNEINQEDKFNTIYMSKKHLNFLLYTYINLDFKHVFDDKDYLSLFNFLCDFSLYDFIKKQLHLLYIENDTINLISNKKIDKKNKSTFLKKINKLKELIEFNQIKQYNKEFIDFISSKFSINYWILFINTSNVDFINTKTIQSSNTFNQTISDRELKSLSTDSTNFLLNDNENKKIKQFITFRNKPFDYEILFSDFIAIYDNLKTNEAIELNQELTDSKINSDTPSKISEYSNYKINTFIHSVYNSNYDKGEIDQKIVDFSLNLNIRQFQYFINGLVIYHEDNNLIFKRDDKVLISLYILNILSENNSENFDEYRTILRHFMNETPNIHIELKNNSDLDRAKSEYEDKVLEGLLSIDRKEEDDDSISLFSFEENEDDESFEENNKQGKPTTLFSEDGTDDDNDINLRPVDNNDLSNIAEIINQMQEDLNKKDDDEKNYVKEVEPKEDVASDEPLYEIFSAESEIEIQSYAEDLGDEGKGVKNQLRRIRKTGNKRYLQSSSKFFEKVDKLRDNFPNFEEFITSIEDYSILNQLGDNHFYIPPSLLVGDPGIGKTFFLSELSDTIGIENKMIHMETMSASWLLVGASSQWKDAKPGIVYDNIIKSKYANNIFILDELDKMMKSNYPVDNCLLQLFEKHTAKEFKDEYIPLKLDISKIIWLATANTLSTISDPILSRLQTYKIANPNFNERKKLAQNIYNHMLAENTWGSHFNPIIPDATLDKLCEPSDSIREMKKVLLKAITHSARRNDNVITIEDIISVNTTSKNKIGFM